jgi:hypothetical protein
LDNNMIQNTDNKFHYLIVSDCNEEIVHYRIYYRKLVEVNPSEMYFLEALTWLALRKMLQ